MCRIHAFCSVPARGSQVVDTSPPAPVATAPDPAGSPPPRSAPPPPARWRGLCHRGAAARRGIGAGRTGQCCRRGSGNAGTPPIPSQATAAPQSVPAPPAAAGSVAAGGRAPAPAAPCGPAAPGCAGCPAAGPGDSAASTAPVPRPLHSAAPARRESASDHRTPPPDQAAGLPAAAAAGLADRSLLCSPFLAAAAGRRWGWPVAAAGWPSCWW